MDLEKAQSQLGLLLEATKYKKRSVNNATAKKFT